MGKEVVVEEYSWREEPTHTLSSTTPTTSNASTTAITSTVAATTTANAERKLLAGESEYDSGLEGMEWDWGEVEVHAQCMFCFLLVDCLPDSPCTHGVQP